MKNNDRLPQQLRFLIAAWMFALTLVSPLYSQQAHSFTGESRDRQTPLLSAQGCLDLQALSKGSIRKPPQSSECGTLDVPLNPADPQLGQISLNILRIPAIQALDRSPLFILVGGPGQAATELASSFAYLFRDIVQKHDLVFVDQRGTGQSFPLDCEIEADTLTGLNPTQKQVILLDLYQACIANSPFTHKMLETKPSDKPARPFALFTTPYTIDDLEAVRKALGYQQINLWGASYGTRVGLAYLRQYPSVIRAAVLDGLSPLAIALPHWTNRDSSEALRQIFVLCEAQSSCNKAYPDLLKRWQTLLKKYKKQPTTVDLSHPRTQERQTLYIDDQTLSSWVRFALYVRDWSPLLPLAIHKATQQDFQTLFSIAVQGSEGMEDGISLLMHMAVICHEDYPIRQSLTKETNDQTGLIHADTSQYDIACPLFNREREINKSIEINKAIKRPKHQTEAISSDAPVLLLSGRLDPATPPIWGKHVHQQLANSQHLIVEGGHHGISALGCTQQIITDFIDQASFDELASDCLNAIVPKPFFVNSAGPSMGKTSNQESP